MNANRTPLVLALVALIAVGSCSECNHIPLAARR